MVDTDDAGWTHTDRYGMLAGWLCPPPHMTLASIEPVRDKPRRQPTPIPSRRDVGQADTSPSPAPPPQWPLPGDQPWWEGGT